MPFLCLPIVYRAIKTVTTSRCRMAKGVPAADPLVDAYGFAVVKSFLSATNLCTRPPVKRSGWLGHCHHGGKMLLGVLVIIALGFASGEVASRLRLPRLIGMVAAGILAGPDALDILPGEILAVSGDIRLFALVVILLKAGLGLDKEKIRAHGSVSVRLGFVPATAEAAVVAVAVRVLLGWDWLSAWLLGWIVCAESPAVIVPAMLRLKAEGLGVKKGIPDLILAGGTVSDAVAVTMFGILAAVAVGGTSDGIWALIARAPVQIVLGIVAGIVAGAIVAWTLSSLRIATNTAHETIIILGAAIALVVGERFLPYSPYLAVMVAGFVVLETRPVIARRIRNSMDRVWIVAEIFLFVMIGAAVNLSVAAEAGLFGLAIVAIGLLVGRTGGILISTAHSGFSIRERFFMFFAYTPKATVQAAIGGIPLALGLPYGEVILAIAVVSIIASAPLGSILTRFFAPRLLEKGDVDATRVTVAEDFKILVVITGDAPPRSLIRETARIARRADAELLILNVNPDPEKLVDASRLREELRLARDVAHEVILIDGNIVETIVEIAREHSVDYIYLSRSAATVGSHDIAVDVIANTDIPVVVVDDLGSE
ncbi:MAG: sodium:proton antiporter [Spirochaetaceae bacterium]|nr:MAG: sodium:proton antiporter [Spirochaetaceae bacterium]